MKFKNVLYAVVLLLIQHINRNKKNYQTGYVIVDVKLDRVKTLGFDIDLTLNFKKINGNALIKL